MVVLVAALVGVAALAHVAPFPFLLDVVAGRRAVWHGPRTGQPPTIYLTFDDGPNPRATPALLDVLGRERARATFFVIEQHVGADTAPLLRRMAQEGHGVALHSNERWLMLRGPGSLARRVRAAADRIAALSSVRPCGLFRPHAGWRSGVMLAGLGRSGYRLAGWSWFAWDWNWFRRPTADSLVRRLERRARDGTIVVIHDGHHRNPTPAREYAIEAVSTLVPRLRARGFAFGNLCEAVKEPTR